MIVERVVMFSEVSDGRQGRLLRLVMVGKGG